MNELLALGRETAELIQNPILDTYVLNHLGPHDDEQMNILILGEPHSKLLELAGQLVGGFSVSHVKTKGSFRIMIRYGEEVSYRWTDPTGAARTVSCNTFISCLEENELGLFCGEIAIPNDSLRDKTVTVFSSAKEYQDVPIDELIMDSDYCFMTMLAIKLLSMNERKIIQKHLMPYMSERMSIVVTGCNYLVDNGFADVREYLAKFTKGKVPTFYLPERSLEELQQFFTKLTAAKKQYRDACGESYKKLYKEHLIQMIDATANALSVENTSIDEGILAIKRITDQFSSRSVRAMRNVRLKHLNALDEECVETLLAFRNAMKRKLEDEIEKHGDLERLQTLIPSYAEDMWNKQLDALYAYMLQKLEALRPELESFIAADVTALLEESITPDVSKMVVNITNEYNIRKLGVSGESLNVKTKRDTANLICGGVIAAGAAMLMLSLPITGLLTLASSGCVYKAKKQAYVSESKQELLLAANDNNDQIYNAAVEEIRQAMKKNAAALNEAIRTCYDSAVQDILDALEDKKHSKDANNRVIDTLHKIKAQLTA